MTREGVLEQAFERLGEFGQLFMEYKGCPRGPIGPRGWPGGKELPDRIQVLIQDIHRMKPVKDVDWNVWRPVLEDDLNQLIEQCLQSREPSGWIPVTERLPDVFRGVLAYCPKNKNIYEVYLNARGEWHFFDKSAAGALVDEDVTNWMPLPEPPKEDSSV